MKRKFKNLISGAEPFFVFVLILFPVITYSQTTYTFSYTGSTQTIILQPGSYSIECWGADGGDASDGSTLMSGGKGGYAAGFFSNSSLSVFNVYVGGHGGNAVGSNVGAGGGGMSDIAPASNPTLIVIAAAGGGGATAGSASEASTGGDGGGLTGGTAIDGTGVSTGTAASGGSQTAGGIAQAGSYGAGTPGGYGYGGGAANGGADGLMHGAGGAGGNGGLGGWNGGGGGCTTTGGNDHAAGGGAGYYGGGGGRGDGGAGGGGSSYIGSLTSGTTVAFGLPGFVTNPDMAGNGYIIITSLCDVNVSASSNPMCEGSVITLSTNAGSNIQWNTGPTTQTIQVSPQSTTSYTVSGVSSSSTACASTVVITVSVNPLPVMTTVSFPPLVCAGSTATVTAMGAANYTWSNGPVSATTAVNPSVPTIYTVTGESAAGCVNTQTVKVNVNTNAVSLAPTESVCAGETATLLASGLVTYTWSTGSHFSALVVSPPASSVYVVQGTDPFGCTLSGSVTLSVQDAPDVDITASQTVICRGEPVTLEAIGADQYQWSTSESTALITQSLNVDVPHHFTVTGTDSKGCTDTEVITIQVSRCLSVDKERADQVSLFPNPTSGIVQLNGAAAFAVVTVTDVSGKKLMSIVAESGEATIDLMRYDAGIYFVTVSSRDVHRVLKVVKN